MQQRVVITGLGVVSPIGNDVQSFEKNLRDGVCGEGSITRFSADDFPVKKAAETRSFISPSGTKRLDPFIQYAVSAADQALEDSGIVLGEYDPFDVGMVMSSSKGGITTYEKNMEDFKRRGSALLGARIYSSFIPNMAAQWIARQKKVRGPAVDYVVACATGTYSISEAAEMIRRGEVKVCIAGASDASIYYLPLAAYYKMGVYAKDRMLPFGKKRSGFIVGEGAGCFILEPLSEAEKRGAKIYAEIGSHVYSSDAYHPTTFNPNGNSLSNNIKTVLKREDLDPSQISYINLHGTATMAGDSYEVKELRKVFGEGLKNIPMSATKSMTGHMLGASGAIEILASVLGISHSFVPPTINLNDLGDEFAGLDFVPEKAREKELQNVLTYSMGFGGHIVSLILKKHD